MNRLLTTSIIVHSQQTSLYARRPPSLSILIHALRCREREEKDHEYESKKWGTLVTIRSFSPLDFLVEHPPTLLCILAHICHPHTLLHLLPFKSRTTPPARLLHFGSRLLDHQLPSPCYHSYDATPNEMGRNKIKIEYIQNARKRQVQYSVTLARRCLFVLCSAFLHACT